MHKESKTLGTLAFQYLACGLHYSIVEPTQYKQLTDTGPEVGGTTEFSRRRDLRDDGRANEILFANNGHYADWALTAREQVL